MIRFSGVKKRGSGVLRDLLIPVLFFAALVLFLLFGVGSVSSTMESEQLKSVEQAVRRTVAQCYALEGSYPPSIDYLTQHYGLLTDNTKYVIHYQQLGGNLMPQISVFPIVQSE